MGLVSKATENLQLLFRNVLFLWLICFQVVWETWERSGKRVRDCNLYTGVLGTAYLLFKSYQVTRNEDDLKLCSEIVEACDVASRDSE